MGTKTEYLGRTDWLFICQLIASEVAKYVKKVEGKGLSTNDLTDELLAKLNGAAPINSPTFIGEVNVPNVDKSDESTKSANTKFVWDVLRDAIKDITGIKFEKVASFQDLPAEGKNGIIYLVPKTTAKDDVFTEYYWVAPIDPWWEIVVNSGNVHYRVSDEDYNAVLSGEKERVLICSEGGFNYYLGLYNGSIAEIVVDSSGAERTPTTTWYSLDSVGNNSYPKKGKLSGTPGYYEILGDTSVDLTNYVTFDDISELPTSEVQTVWDSVFGNSGSSVTL